jgi:F-type H+-transporting ATPase subunit a
MASTAGSCFYSQPWGSWRRIYPPILPHIQLPPERLSATPLVTLPIIGPIYLTNTLVATFIADIILLLIAWTIYRAVRSGQLVPKGLAGAIEALLEVLNNLTESTAGRWTGRYFLLATIVLLVLTVNWMELIGVDSIGLLEPSEHGYPVKEVIPCGDDS